MFSRNLCSYDAHLINYWSTPMATMYFSSCLDYNNPLIIIKYFSNESIANIDFKTLINALDLEHCYTLETPPSIRKHRYFFPVVCSLDNCGVVLVLIVSPKEEERELFF